MSDEFSLGAQIGILIVLLILSAFFSSSETALMSLNRYRLRHRSRSGHRGAQLAEALLKRPDRIIGLILLGNNLTHVLAASLTTLIAVRHWGENSVAVAALVLTVVILIFAEVMPKTAAAMNPEKIAFPAAFLFYPLLKVLYPVIWLLNGISNGLLWLIGIRNPDGYHHHLSKEELRAVLTDPGTRNPRKRQQIMTRILDLETITVEDVMVPRADVVGIDLAHRWEDILRQIQNTQYTRMPVFSDELDNLQGVLHLRSVVRDLAHGRLERDALARSIREPYFVHEGTTLNRQLFHFQNEKQRLALVVDEYGDLQGLVTLEDILEEIVGDFTSDPADLARDVLPQRDGTYIVNGGANVRDLNRSMDWDLPVDGPKTLNGLIVDYLESIPEPGTGLKLSGYPIEILNVTENTVKNVRIHPRIETIDPKSEPR
ncbi:MAG: HlyC/CorC family transporter [Gammaproteobacteria bacterium]|nr:HlyC/CorC family transporter [Gammaproteobacteria bacterium]